eukprot:TRINITY_DN13741_c0_g1_i1.p2 TRINITY_DN13741_c0_g1~~TRINITY_DN13741_c0_g1_i1.p2  ORF type:complete len:104 (-),score=20.39 TRINITY_DN13741_c0_g1_i1:267-578(-)
MRNKCSKTLHAMMGVLTILFSTILPYGIHGRGIHYDSYYYSGLLVTLLAVVQGALGAALYLSEQHKKSQTVLFAHKIVGCVLWLSALMYSHYGIYKYMDEGLR